ncbi:MAG: long-chain fatty acid--CoA ligase [Mariprofundaceae bacterium]|nr:long-chain fatty acid--CoA ligase [Mariprofundaceae bacterium]
MRRRECIDPELAQTIPELFQCRVQYAADAVAYRYFDDGCAQWKTLTWQQISQCVRQWQAAFQRESLTAGDRVAVMIPNSPRWVMFDQAALAMGLVVVPLYLADRAENIAYILQHSGAKLLLLNGSEQWQRLQGMHAQLNGLIRILSIKPLHDPRSNNLMSIKTWLIGSTTTLINHHVQADDLASIVYTSGTTGHAKGVMLSHRNMLHNAWAGIQHIRVYSDDVFLSFLPLSHTLERTVGYYLPMMAGAQVAYARSIPQLAEDLGIIKPTVIITVPRIFERIYEKMSLKINQRSPFIQRLFTYAVDVGWHYFLYHQGQARWHPSLLLRPFLQSVVGRGVLQAMGGRMRFAISGGAALNVELSRTFIALGLHIQQGYGLTENSPVISVNPIHGNRPASVGSPLDGTLVKLDEKQELLVKGLSVMLGYWNDKDATKAAITHDGWLRTGDLVRIDEYGHLYITGRLKDIIVLSNGEKICPLDMESMLMLDPAIAQAVVIGEGRPYLAALLVISETEKAKWQGKLAVNETLLQYVPMQKKMLKCAQQATREFPAYAKIRRVIVATTPWSIENKLLTPTLKQRRQHIIAFYKDGIDALYRLRKK